MTEQQWAEIALSLVNSWGAPELDDMRLAAYKQELGGFDYDVVRAALTVLKRKGPAFRPWPPEIAAECQNQLLPRLSWGEAWKMIRAAFRRHYDPEHGINARRVIDDLNDAGQPLVALFVSTYGAQRLYREPIHHADYGGKIEKDIEAKWNEHVQASHDRIAAGHTIDPAGEAVRRIESGPPKLRQLNPAVTLFDRAPGRPELEAGTGCPADDLDPPHRDALDVIWAPIIRRLREADQAAHDRFAGQLHIHGVSDTGLIIGCAPDLEPHLRDQLAEVLAALADRPVTVIACAHAPVTA